MTKKRGHGEGTYTQLPSGRWRAQVMINGMRHNETRDTRAEAQRWVRQMKQKADDGLVEYDAAKTRFGDFLDDYLQNKEGVLRIYTRQLYARLAADYVQPALGKIKLQDLTGVTLQAFYSHLQKEGRGARTIENVHMIIHSCLAHAVKIGLLARNASDAVIVPRRQRTEMKFWTESEVSQFLVTARGHPLEPILHLALATGMRSGELRGLRWADIDWANQMIQVRQQAIHPAAGGYTFGPPKTQRGRRAVQVGAGVIERLRLQAATVDRLRTAAGARWVEHDLVFPSAVGTPITGQRLRKGFAELQDAAGLKQIRLHDCRHTATSLMLRHGIQPAKVAEIIGESLTSLLQNYAHFIPGGQDAAAQLMDSITTIIEVDI